MKKYFTKYMGLPVQIRASLWFVICGFLQKGISMLTTPIFTRLLTTSEYGQFNVFNSWLGIVTIFACLNLSCGVYSQGLIKFEDDRKAFTSSLQTLSTCFILTFTILYCLNRDFWNGVFKLTTVQVFSMFILIWTTEVYRFWAESKRVLYQYKQLVFVTVIVCLAKPIVGILFVINANDKVTARILGLVLVELIGYAFLFIVQMIKGKKLYVGSYWKYAIMYNLPLLPHYLSQIILNSSDRIMIDRIVGEDAAGIYSLAYALSSMMILFNNALSNTITPWIYRKIRDKNISRIGDVSNCTLVIIAGVNLGLILIAPEGVALFAPSEYYDAIWVIPPVAMSGYFMFAYDLFAKFAFYFEKNSMVMVASVLGALLNIGLNYIFINQYGYIAAGYTTLICYIVYCIAHYLLMRRICKQFCDSKSPYDIKRISIITILFLIAGFSFLLTYKSPVVRYSFVVVVLIALLINYKRICSMLKEILAIKNK